MEKIIALITHNDWFSYLLAAMMRVMSNVAQIVADEQSALLAKENALLKATVLHLESKRSFNPNFP